MPDVMYAQAKQDNIMRLYMARFFHLDTEDVAYCLGLDKLVASDKLAYETAKQRLLGRFYTQRSKVFGNGAFIAEFAEHAVKQHDFEATVFNLARLEKLSRIVPPAGETSDERRARETLRDAYQTSMQEHLTRLTESRAAAVRKADAELTRLELLSNDKRKSNRPSSSGIQKARRVLKHHRDPNVRWSPNIAVSFSQREVAPPAELLYAQKMLSVQQTLWEKLFKEKFAAELFWFARSVVDIPSTLADPDILEYYELVFTVGCHELWRFVIGVEADNEFLTEQLRKAGVQGITIQMSSEANRSSRVFSSIRGINDKFFSESPGLDWLKVVKTSSSKANKKHILDHETPDFSPCKKQRRR